MSASNFSVAGFGFAAGNDPAFPTLASEVHSEDLSRARDCLAVNGPHARPPSSSSGLPDYRHGPVGKLVQRQIPCWSAHARSLLEFHNVPRLLLRLPKRCIPAVLREQRLVGSLFNNDARVQHDNMIRIYDC